MFYFILLILFYQNSSASEFILEAPKSIPAYAQLPVRLRAKIGTAGYLIFYHLASDEAVKQIPIRPFHSNRWRRLTIDTPKKTGQYELCWESSSFGKKSERNQNYACRPIEIKPVKIKIKAPKTAVIGQSLTIKLVVPPNLGGYLRLYNQKNQIIKSKRIRAAYRQQNIELKIQLPEQAGKYEIRWDSHIFGKNYRFNRVLARHSLELKNADIRLDYPARVRPGQIIEVNIQAPPNLEGYIRIYQKNIILAGQEIQFDRVHHRYSPVQLKIPLGILPGIYVIRWDTHVFGWHRKNEILFKDQLFID